MPTEMSNLANLQLTIQLNENANSEVEWLWVGGSE